MAGILEDTKLIVDNLRRQKEHPDRETVRVPLFSVPDILRLLASRSHDRILHVYPILDEDVRPRAFDLHIWRQLAKRETPVSRIYAVPHSGFARAALEAALSEDRAHGLDAHVITLSAVPPERLSASINQYVISPQKFVFQSDQHAYTDGGEPVKDWILSTESQSLLSALDLWETLQNILRDKTLYPALIDLEEPLVLSADLISGVASVLCCGDHVDRTDCSWYHGTWQYMRLLDLVSTPTWHDSFYRSAFHELFTTRPRARVLVSGTADYSLLAFIYGAAKKSGARPDIFVLDQCATPLFACRWFAKYFRIDIKTIQGDIFDATRLLPGQFDLITSDAFLTRFTGDDIGTVINTWRSLVAHGGQVITTVRMHGSAVEVRDAETAVSDFVTRARNRLPRWKQFLRQPSQKLVTAIELYARRMVSNRVGDEQDIVRLFKERGFSIRYTELGDVPGELYPTVYLRLVAELDGSGQ